MFFLINDVGVCQSLTQYLTHVVSYNIVQEILKKKHEYAVQTLRFFAYYLQVFKFLSPFRLAYLILEKVFRFAFYIWIGTLDELRHEQMTRSLNTLCDAEGEIKNHLVLRKHTLVMPRIGKPIPSTFMTTLLVNKISPDFCVRLYRVEPESSMWDDREDDVTR